MTEITMETPFAMSFEPPRYVRADGFDYDHEVLIALPPSYHLSPDRTYPVLWSTDGALLFNIVAGIVSFYTTGFRLPEMIVVGVGHRSEDGMTGLARRTADFFPPGSDLSGDELASSYMRDELGADPDAIFAGVKGDKFLDFLVDRLRPLLAGEYRMSDDHALFGHSAGAAFGGYALFTRPGTFKRYLLGSGCNTLTLGLEAEYAKSHDDLPARVFVSAGDLEANNLGLSAQRLVSRTLLFAENVLLRRYPSLALKTRVYTDRDHINVVPLIVGDGLQFIYADEVEKLPTLPW